MENDGDILISSSRIILFYFPYFLHRRGLKGTRIRYDSSSLKNTFSFFAIRYFMSFFIFLLLGERTWKLGEIKANDYSREEKFSSTRWKKISILRCSPASNLSLATLHPISNVDSYVVAHLTAPRLIDIFDVVEIEEKREGLSKIEKLFHAVIYFSFLLVVSSYFIFTYQEIMVLIEEFQ